MGILKRYISKRQLASISKSERKASERMWGFGSASCYEAAVRAYYDAHLEQMRSQYRELPIPRHLPPFLPPSFEQFMCDHQQQVEAQQERQTSEVVSDVSKIVGREDMNWLWSYESSLITDESDYFLAQANSVAAPSCKEDHCSLKRFEIDNQLDRPSRPLCVGWLIEQSNVISERLHRATQPPLDR